MRITIVDGIYKGVHITGPTHNYLGVMFGTNSNPVFEIDVLPAIGGCSHGAILTEAEVRPWIEEGFRLAKEQIGQTFPVARVEVVENDSRRPEVYRELARRILILHHEENS